MPRRLKRTASVDDTLRSRSSHQRAPSPFVARAFAGGSHGKSRRMHEHHYKQAEFERMSLARAAAREAEQDDTPVVRSRSRLRRTA